MTFVFIHGAGFTGEIFGEQMRAFSGSLAPNLPGHCSAGESKSIDSIADWICEYAEAKGLSDVVLSGHSMGGAVTLEVALRRPAWLRGAVVIGGGARMRVAPAILDGLAGDFEGTLRTIAGHFFADPTPERIEAALATMSAVGQAQTLRDFQACDAFNALERVAEIAVPLLAISGESDRLMPAKFASALADRVPGGQARIIPDAGHFVMVERPAETNECIATFLDGLS